MLARIFFLALIIRGVAAFSLGGEEEGLLDQEVPHPDLVIVLQTSKNEVRVNTKRSIIVAAKSKILAEMLEEAIAEQKNESIVELHLRVEELEVFKRVIRYLNGGDIDFSNLGDLALLIRYAHEYDIELLGEAIAAYMINTRCAFLDDADDDITLIITLAARLREASGPSGIEVADAWGAKALTAFIKYILISYLTNDPRDLRGNILKATKRDPKIQAALLTPHAMLVDECTDLVIEKRGAIQRDRQEKELARNKAEAARIAKELAIKVIGSKLLEISSKGKRPMTIYVEAEASLASLVAQSLENELPNFQAVVDPDIDTYKLPYQRTSPPFFCSCCNSNGKACCDGDGSCCLSCGHFGACLFSSLFTLAGLQCLQAITCGWFGCCGTDCLRNRDKSFNPCRAVFDDRTGSMLFYCIYDGAKSLGNCLKGGRGTTRTIKLTRR